MSVLGREVSLSEVCVTITYGYTASATNTNTQTKFLRITDIVPSQIDWESVPYCEIDSNNLAKYKLQVGDIVIARTGATTGWNKTIKSLPYPTVYASYLIKYSINREIADPFYVGYNLRSSQWYDYVDAIAGGSAQPGANAKQLGSFNFILPPINEQKAIASVLSALDDKIDLLHRQNKTLENMAEILFRQWFDNEQKNNLKEGKLSDILSLRYGKALKKENRSGEGFPVVASGGIVGFHNEYLVNAPGIVIGRKGTLGKVYYMHENFYPIDTSFYIESKIKNSKLFYEYFLLKSLGFENMNSDSAVPGLNRDSAMSSSITLHSFEMIINFNDFCEDFFNKIKINSTQIDTLENLRDTLLPKLMSGEVRVQYAEEAIASVA